MLALARSLKDAGNTKEADGLFGRVVAIWSGFSKVEDLVKESPDVSVETRIILSNSLPIVSGFSRRSLMNVV